MNQLPPILTNLLPIEAVLSMRSGSPSELEEQLGTRHALVVRLEELDDELSRGLRKYPTHSGWGNQAADGDALGFQTEILDHSVHLDRAELVSGQRILMGDLRTKLFFLVPLKRRDDTQRPFAQRITVGRARNSDVVLRHPSVSKFHAWFEMTDSDVQVADAGSSNGTLVGRSDHLVPKQGQTLESGQAVTFGKVQCRLLPLNEIVELVVHLTNSRP